MEKINEHWVDVGDKRESDKIRLALLQLGKNDNKMSSLELTVADDREAIDAIKAKDVATTWMKTKTQKEKETQQKAMTTKVVLSGKSHAFGAADAIADFLRCCT